MLTIAGLFAGVRVMNGRPGPWSIQITVQISTRPMLANRFQHEKNCYLVTASSGPAAEMISISRRTLR
jgi:hypothetical protein